MIFDNNPAVGLETRRWLLNAKRDGIADEEGIVLMGRAIEHCRWIHPGGMVLDIARSLGAGRFAALTAGSTAEMFYSVCSLTDDIQDDDTESYLGNVSPAILVNMQSQLLCLVGVRAADLSSEIGDWQAQNLVVALYRTGSKMLTGQQYEIRRTPWNASVYHQVARLSAGEQFGFYMQLAAIAAKSDKMERYRELGRLYGTLLQYVVDIETSDPRLNVVDAAALSSTKEQLAAELCILSHSLIKESVRKSFDGLLKRCSATRH